MGLAKARGEHMGDSCKVPKERGVHPVNLMGFGTKAMYLVPKEPWLNQPPLKVYFTLNSLPEPVYVPVSGFSYAGRLSLRRQDGKLIHCQLLWSQPDGFCSLPDTDQTQTRGAGGTKSLTQVLQRAMSKTNPQLLSSPCKMLLIMAPWQDDCKV